jgi:hypothetical protein
LRRLLLASAALSALCLSALSARGAEATRASAESHTAALAYLGRELRAYEVTTWRWERLTGSPLTETAGRVLAAMSLADAIKAVRVWRVRAAAALRRAQHPPHLAEWLCIHHYEGSWTDRGDPYWGGLQMSLSFQERYGGRLYQLKGTADHWTPLEQMWTAEKALRTRGFWPWPNTARMCGLL